MNLQKVFSSDRLDDAYTQMMKYCLMNPALGPMILSKGYVSAVFSDYVSEEESRRGKGIRQIKALLPTVSRTIEAGLKAQPQSAAAIEREVDAIVRGFEGVGDEELEKLVMELPKTAGKK